MPMHFEKGFDSVLIVSDEETGEDLFAIGLDQLLDAMAFWYELESSDEVIRAIELLDLEKQGAIPSKNLIANRGQKVTSD